jgi:mono/diheme cytochrome c family protein
MRRVLRAIGLGVLAVALVLVASVVGLSERRIGRRFDVATTLVAARTDSLAISRGAYLYRTITCAECHGDDGGGTLYQDAGPIGILAGPNLTMGRGGIARDRSDADWVRAIRHGVRRDGTSLLVMPSEVFAYLSDHDLGALLGYMRQLEPVDRELPASRIRWLGRVLLAAGRLDLFVAGKTPAGVAHQDAVPDTTAAYGRYLADIAGCHGCHGFGLSGGRVAGPPGLPPASNLTSEGLRGWDRERFVTVMRTGRRADGTELNAFMPFRQFRHMTDGDLTALWRYLESVPPKPFGGK